MSNSIIFDIKLALVMCNYLMTLRKPKPKQIHIEPRTWGSPADDLIMKEDLIELFIRLDIINIRVCMCVVILS